MRMESAGQVKDTIVHCKHVSKSFTTKRKTSEVIRDVSVEVAQNELVVLFGPGQCGKTTLLNVLAGLEPPSSGTVYVGNKVVTAPGIDRGVVYQTTSLFPWLTVMGNVSFGPRMRGMKKKDWEKKARHYIDLVGLSGFDHTFPVQLSGGMKQRVGIARAYCNEPLVLFMDEPFGHLDAQTRYLMQNELMRIWQSDKRTVVFVTNNIEEAIFLADRIIVLTNCPAEVKQEFIIDLPRPRDYVSQAFLELRGTISGVVDKTL